MSRIVSHVLTLGAPCRAFRLLVSTFELHRGAGRSRSTAPQLCLRVPPCVFQESVLISIDERISVVTPMRRGPGKNALRRRTGRVAALLLLSLVAAQWGGITVPAKAGSQPQATAETRPISVIVGFDTNVPGRPVSVPLILDLPENARVGRIDAEIRFPVKSLEFQQARRALAAELAGAAVNATATSDPSDPDHSILKITLTAPAGTVLRNGIAANMDFRITDQATIGESVILRNSATAVGADTTSQRLEPVESQDGEVQIAAAPPVVTACFFYMH
jgi:hypothetical protein